jgi:beta-fructofuranosidase
MNDPNGLIQWNGQYHLFYQHNPSSPLWGNMHWGHAVSPDLIHWQDLPIALAPTPGGPDAAGVFSGCAVNNDGVPTLIYTATAGEHNEIQTQALATSRDGLLTWEKYAQNPLIGTVPAEARQTSDFRDPFVWKEGDTWYMVVASRVQDVGGIIFLYRSANLLEWEYLHPLLASHDQTQGIIWECPNFFPVGDQWVLILSAHAGTYTDTVRYFVGTYQDLHFTPTYSGILDYGCMYAPLTFVDNQERRVLVGWLREERSNEALQAAGWAGVQSIPRILSLDEQKRLVMKPVPELEHIRGQHRQCEAGSLNQPISLHVPSTALDIIVEYEPNVRSCDVVLAFSFIEEAIQIRYDASRQQISVHKAGETPDTTGKPVLEAPHPLATGESLTLRILLDNSIVEVIANGRTSISTRFYAKSATSTNIRISGDAAQLRSLNVWELPALFGT